MAITFFIFVLVFCFAQAGLRTATFAHISASFLFFDIVRVCAR